MDPTPQGPSAVVRCLALVATALGVLVGAAACSKNDEPDSPTATLATAPETTSSTTTDTTTTTTVEDIEAEVEAAYLEAERVLLRRRVDRTPTIPGLAETHDQKS